MNNKEPSEMTQEELSEEIYNIYESYKPEDQFKLSVLVGCELELERRCNQ